MNCSKTRYLLPGCCLLMLTGCVDDKYDLSNIDTTTRIEINNLTLPVNVSPVTLNDIIDVKEGDDIEEVTINGKTYYAVKRTGNFESDEIHIAKFHTNIPIIDDAYATYSLTGQDAPAQKRRREDNAIVVSHKYTLKSSERQIIDFDADNIDESIHDLTSLTMEPLYIKMNISADGLIPGSEIEFTKLTLDFIPNLKVKESPAYSYSASDGILEIHDLKAIDGKTSVTVIATELSFPKENGKSAFDYASHTLRLSNHVQIMDGTLNYTFKLDPNNVPDVNDEIHFTISTTAITPSDKEDVHAMDVVDVSGSVQYTLDGSDLNIDPVDLSSLPDFLNDKETHLKLANPQILFKINNPVADEKLNVTTGLKLTSINDGVRTVAEINKTTANPDGVVTIDWNHGTAKQNILISPSKDDALIDSKFLPLTEWVEFTGLRNILYGNGLPQTIEIDLDHPQIPLQTVEKFPLGVDLPKAEGEYEFLAPLALANEEGVQIVYSKSWDNWNDEDVDKLAIRTLSVSAVATSTIPLNASMTASVLVLDDNGNIVVDRTAKCEAFNLPGNAVNTPVTFVIKADDPEKPIRHLAGIRIQALVTPHSNDILSPEMTISLSDIKAVVSGYYDIKDDDYKDKYND